MPPSSRDIRHQADDPLAQLLRRAEKLPDCPAKRWFLKLLRSPEGAFGTTRPTAAKARLDEEKKGRGRL
jgi:hypothetical protein